MRVLMLDNYDSFTYNLVQIVKEFSQVNPDLRVEVFRNDEIPLEDVASFDKIILSPGPGLPKEAGTMKEIIEEYKNRKPILGICLGMQAIGEVFGATLYNLDYPLHGVSTRINCDTSPLFLGLPSSFSVGRYHSWAIDRKTLSDQLKVSAVDLDGVVMAVEHENLPVFGLQFHPESILTEYGKQMVYNFLNLSE